MADEAFVPHLRRVTREFDPSKELRLQRVENPLPNRTLGAAGPAIAVDGREEFPLSPLIIPFTPEDVTGIDVASIRLFRLEKETGRFRPIWSSGANETLGYFHAKIGRPGVYLPIGLPRDVLLRESLRMFSRARMHTDAGDRELLRLWKRAFAVFAEAPEEAVEELREFLTRMEIRTGPGLDALAPWEVRLGKGGHPQPFPLPRDASVRDLGKLLGGLEIGHDGLPEEELFRDPVLYREDLPPWMPSPEHRAWNGIEHHNVERLKIWDQIEKIDVAVSIQWLFSKNWWMHQHDRQHTGAASGGSNINAASVHRMKQIAAVPVDGPVITKPAIVNGKIYIGTGKQGGPGGGTLYKIDLATGGIDDTFATSGTAFYSWVNGIGGSPAVVGNRVYISTVYGKIYCIDRTTFAQLWMTDLKVPSQTQNQPVDNPDGDSWSGPLVVNNRVYVSGGEGESNGPFGFIFCLDAITGQVIWLFCTNKFVDPDNPGNENQPNVIPRSGGVSDPLPAWAIAAGFSLQDDPPNKGSAPWCSCVYDQGLNRIYVCTGNARPDTPLPDERYASGLISLDATTGEFRGFFQPLQSDSYWPGDFDVDVPCPPTVYTRSGGQRVVCFGSKNGSFFILDADTLAVVARRQLLPKEGGTGLPGDVGNPIHSVVPLFGTPPTGENKWGVFATPAVHAGLGRLFVGLGGYMGIADFSKTPFMRAVDWDDLSDAWATAVGPDDVIRYTTTSPPMYTTDESGLSAPAVVNDVVFVSTSKTALYALDANTGVCLWSAKAGSLGGDFSLGPAIYGDYVVVGAGNTVYIYRLQCRWFDILDEVIIRWPIHKPGPWPWPEPDPLVLELLQQIHNAVRLK